MTNSRRTRLIRVQNLHQFRGAIAALCAERPGAGDARAIVVPTRAAATLLQQTLVHRIGAASGAPGSGLVTRDELYDTLHGRLVLPPVRLTPFERQAMIQAAAEEAAREVEELPFRVRPGLVAEILRFYDHLRRQAQQVRRFEELITEALGGDETDRGAVRLLRQTRFLSCTFRGYERRVAASGACDEHVLRDRLVDGPIHRDLRHVIVTVPDWIADPAGLFVADFDLLARLPGLEVRDIVCTSLVLESGFHERLHGWWPGVEEVEGDALLQGAPVSVPRIIRPPDGDPAQLWFTYRDREEEMSAIVRRLAAGPTDEAQLDRTAVVFKQPLPYLYLAPATFGSAGIAYQAADALPLATEPVVATVDLVLEAVETGFSRTSLINLLRSPHLVAPESASEPFRDAVSAMNRALSDARYLGGLDRLELLAAACHHDVALPAFQRAVALASELSGFLRASPASQHLTAFAAFLEHHWRPSDDEDPFCVREARARAVVLQLLRGMAAACAAHHNPDWTAEDLAAAVRRAIEAETFPVDGARLGVHLVDDQAARYGEFDDLTIVGLVESEWPERHRRNVFYSPGLLKPLNWPSEKDRSAAALAHFLDLLASSSMRVGLSTFLLDDESMVSRSLHLDAVAHAKLSSVPDEPASLPVLRHEALAADPPRVDLLSAETREWAALRIERSPREAPEFHGWAGPLEHRPWSVSALETYLSCPFKFFAQRVLKLDEEPEDEEVLDPRHQGQLVHEVFEAFFRDWQSDGHSAITSSNLDHARDMFASVVDRSLARFPTADAALERTRLLGSSAAAGLGEAVFRMEAERQVAVVERLIEHSLDGWFTLETGSGPREVALRGKVDRIDLLDDGTLRIIDYKLGWPPDRNRALQLPIYGVCAEQRLAGRGGRTWRLGEALYLAFKGPKRVVPLFTQGSSRDEVLLRAQQRVADTIDAIGRGEFPPTPVDIQRCDTCSAASVCRRDYVGDV